MSKGKEKTNGTDQKGTAVAERASGRADSEQSVSAHQDACRRPALAMG